MGRAESVVREIEARGFKVQTIDAAIGDLNLDRYPVAISRFPEGWDAPNLLQHFIGNINQFVDTDLTEFIPYDKRRAAAGLRRSQGHGIQARHIPDLTMQPS